MSVSRRRRRLLMVVHGPYPVGEPRVAREALAARDRGWEVDVVAMRRPGEPARETVDGVEVVRLPLDHRRGGGAAAVMAEYLGFAALASVCSTRLARARRYGVVQIHAPPDFLALAALGPRAFGARVVLDIHDPSPEMFAMRFAGRRGAAMADRLLRALERTATRLSDHVVTVHEPYRRELVARGVPRPKTTVVMNSLDERLLTQAATASPPAGFRVFYHGTVTPPYGVELLVEAAARAVPEIPDLSLEICGEGDAVERVRERARELAIADRVTAEGRMLPQSEVLARAALATVGVIPNLPLPLSRYALSTKLFEYVALGIPAVVSSLPTLREYFSDDEVRFFEAGDADALAAALVDVYSDPAHAAARARAARVRYEGYRWPSAASEYTDVLESLL